ncbi:amidase [Rhodococcus rhodochrous]|uniref:amidase n=1 Tax=Rhodococcus rhodochrous TaxID=1829 RepID=UPI001E3E3BA2|nr:amidase [Rhodococcus rhodochrous]MCD2100403.1 amidase [Rhodococcus rhodochrous]MCD2124727.1 amidase [Rhodococcus rhodochrous]MCQ4138075.1 amidase [Rhodococcus rhodochrous]MDJ0021585.1 amidase [Rhodococcus rhodochrous]
MSTTDTGVHRFGTVVEIHDQYLRATLSPVDVTEVALERITERNGVTNALITVLADAAREAAAASAHRYRELRPLSPLDGIPVSVKDAFEMADVRFTAGSLLFGDRIGATNAGIVCGLQDAGAVIVGKSNCAELTLGFTSENRVTGPVPNPDHPGLDAGGSSSGDVAAVRAGMVKLGFGSDLAGSLRLPAAWSGCWSLKPTPGLLPTSGHFPDAWHDIAVAGPIAVDPRDLRAAMRVLHGRADIDPSCGPVFLRSRGLDTFAVVDQVGPTVPVSAVAESLSGLAGAAAGAGYSRIRIGDALDDVLHTGEQMFWGLAGGYGGNPDSMGAILPHLEATSPGFQYFLGQAAANPVNLADFARAEAERAVLSRAVRAVFDDVDFLMMPASPVLAQSAGFTSVRDGDGVEHEILTAQRCSWITTMLGLPSVTVPIRTVTGLHAGVQLVGPRWSDLALIDAAQRITGIGAKPVRR